MTVNNGSGQDHALHGTHYNSQYSHLELGSAEHNNASHRHPSQLMSSNCYRLSRAALHSAFRHNISAPIAVLIGILCFFSGRLIQQSAELPEPSSLVHVVAPSRSLKGIGNMTATSKAPEPSWKVDPLNQEQRTKQWLESSGFLAVRPPLNPGQSGNLYYNTFPVQVLSWYPRTFYFPAFLDKARCEHFIALAEKHMFPSALAYRPGEKADSQQQVRTSSGTFLAAQSDPDGVLSWLEERIAAATMIPVHHGEAFNVLRYENSQHYDSHYDSFNPKEYGKQPNQRVATFLLFLSDVEEGGETVFKREGQPNGDKVIQDFKSCSDSEFKVKPRQGDAVLFWSTNLDSSLDSHSMHGACPVARGVKWSAAKWLHDKPLFGDHPKRVV